MLSCPYQLYNPFKIALFLTQRYQFGTPCYLQHFIPDCLAR
jgi:hypothetical protein